MILKNFYKTVLVTATLLACNSASATTLPWFWQGTLAEFSGLSSLSDSNPTAPSVGISSANPTGDGDTSFKFIASNFDPLTTLINISEQLVAGQDLYSINVYLASAQNSGFLSYAVSTTDPEGFSLASLDTIVPTGIGHVQKTIQVNNASGANLLTLDSFDGSPVPPVGFSGFQANNALYLTDTIIPSTGGAVRGFGDNISTAVPEAEEWVMILLGLPMIASIVRRKQAA